MDKRTRAYKLYQTGLTTFEKHVGGKASANQASFLAAMAAMIAEGTKKTTSKRPEVGLPFSTSLFLNKLAVSAGDFVIATPFNKQWTYRAKATLAGIEGVQLADGIRVGEHLASGGWRGDNVPTLGTVIKFLPELIAEARNATPEVSKLNEYV